MNALRNHVLQEVARLDLKSLLAIQSVMDALKKPTTVSIHNKRGVAAARCRQILAKLPGSLSQTIHEEREDRV
ncbi:hypothetical protein HMY34_08800 [Thiothrix subterranea]|uniref:hypothetical protein n=1 Tax=Thiothrix subterranea TaxID=2735563 RepID=UPI00192C00B8|nr:hypothetical protein [Thiothrix subterranea]QQZ28842.1 hypothetical protein HMY34_08800 [Thiothrix subterranea]